jgi:hypothetical protein
MVTEEGVIRFSLLHRDSAPPCHPGLEAMQHWHSKLHALGLISQDKQRYAGYAYGNMSIRLDEQSFIISGTQTAGLAALDNSHYAIVDDCDIQQNRVVSHGPVKPSSECMTHAAVYLASPQTTAIVHVHSAVIWHHYAELQLAATPADVEYGTPAMADAVRDCVLSLKDDQQGCITMLGHEDGVICFAASVESASKNCIGLLQQAQQLR